MPPDIPATRFVVKRLHWQVFTHGDRCRCLTIRSTADESHVRVSFRDSGSGVPREVRQNLFQPFFTTKEAGQGTGLGLSVSYRILQEHRGTLIEKQKKYGINRKG